MCGITGYIDYTNTTENKVLIDMVKTLDHRGPDDAGEKFIKTKNATIGLGQARLSIIDLSTNGHQPMHYKEYTIVYNGEIYNYKEIKEALINLGHTFTTDSDTEVILHAYEQWQEQAVDKFIGMFAIVIFNSETEELILIRDRAGVKPLFYYKVDGLFLFTSEVKAFYKHPLFKKEINQSSLELYFDFGYVPAPYAIFKNTYKVEPGGMLKINISTGNFKEHIYWRVEDYYKKEKSNLSYDEAKEKLKKILESACEYRMVADVPVGVFLSGGYDSSLVTAMLQKDRKEKIKTFTIGFEEGNNEAGYAKQVADYLGTDHTEYICTYKEAQEIIPTLPYYYDEPFADSSAIPTILVSKLAKKKVKVALSADAGDELFGGYTRYLSLKSKLKVLNKIPSQIHGLTKFSIEKASKFIRDSNVPLHHKIKGISFGIDENKMKQSAKIFKYMSSLPETYSSSIFSKTSSKPKTNYDDDYSQVKNEIELAMLIDYKMYLQNDILTKVDRATMSVSLEGREPLLDHRLIEFAATLPLEYKIQGNKGKRILKDIVHDLLPKDMMDRPKAGFSIPINSWLTGELSYLLEEYLNKDALSQSDLFNIDNVLEIVTQYKKNNLHYKTLIWKLLVFQMWYFKWIK